MSNQPVAMTIGEPGGVGGEIAHLAWRALRHSGPTFFVIDDPARLERIGAPVTDIASPDDAHATFPDRLPVIALSQPVTAEPGRASPSTAASVIESIERAVAFAIDGRASAVVTNPIQKSALNAAGFAFPGHTEFLGALCSPDDDPSPTAPIMMLAGPRLKTVPATVHEPLARAVESLSTEKLETIGARVHSALKRDFGIDAPRVVFSGLNPHAGEDGLLGAEDETIIAPAVDALRARGLDVRGPAPADTLFHEEARETYDAVICMYHDQALIPVKTLDFHGTVNVTLGLPIVRTSPDHGTALDLAGTGRARPDSLIAAVKLAAEIAARRHS
ncbi:MAG: 4-hydroxythreonine-4-phosphate dehydrogenase PdxA [Pseudomonadota bacterium]